MGYAQNQNGSSKRSVSIQMTLSVDEVGNVLRCELMHINSLRHVLLNFIFPSLKAKRVRSRYGEFFAPVLKSVYDGLFMSISRIYDGNCAPESVNLETFLHKACALSSKQIDAKFKDRYHEYKKEIAGFRKKIKSARDLLFAHLSSGKPVDEVLFADIFLMIDYAVAVVKDYGASCLPNSHGYDALFNEEPFVGIGRKLTAQIIASLNVDG